VGWKKEGFIGADALRRQKQEGVSRRLIGFEVLDRAIARHGYDVYVGAAKAGVVTSGTQTPYLKKAIGMAYLPAAQAVDGTEFEIDVRGRRVRARTVPMPFYKRAR
jgi:aminomethyltransferase